MTKRFFAFVIAMSMIFSMTACGNTVAKTEPAPTTTEQVTESQGEGPVQGGIKSDEEIAALQEEEATYASEESTEEIEYAENVDNTGHEPEAYGSGNFQDYWKGEDYFDIEAYLQDNGCDYFAPTNGEDHNKVKNGAKAYYALFNDSWEIYISPDVGCSLINYNPANESGYIINDPTILSNTTMVKVNNQGTEISMGTLIILDMIVNALHQYPDDTDPMQYFDIYYASYTS